MKKATFTLAVLAASMLASAAHAEARWPNWYVGLHGGVNWAPDSDLKTNTTNVKLESKTGFIAGASLGYAPPVEEGFFSNTRWELEYSFRSNDNDVVGPTPITGQVQSSTFMANMIYDFTNDTRFTPYLGAGAGFSSIQFDTPTGAPTDENPSDTVFAYQFIGGLEYAPVTMPMTAWGIRYRYMDTDGAQYNSGGETYKLEYDSHSVEATGRFRF